MNILKYKSYNLNNTENNLQLHMSYSKVTPLLSLTDNFISNNLISKEEILIPSNDNKLIDNSPSKNTLIFICKIKTINGTVNTIFYDTDRQILVNSNGMDDFDSDLFKDTILDFNVNVYSEILIKNDRTLNNNLSFIPTSDSGEIPPTNTLEGITLNVHTLDVTGLGLCANIKKFTYEGIPNLKKDINILSILEVNLTDLGWTIETMPRLWTIHNIANELKTVRFLGKKNIDKIYIPLF